MREGIILLKPYVLTLSRITEKDKDEITFQARNTPEISLPDQERSNEQCRKPTENKRNFSG